MLLSWYEDAFGNSGRGHHVQVERSVATTGPTVPTCWESVNVPSYDVWWVTPSPGVVMVHSTSPGTSHHFGAAKETLMAARDEEYMVHSCSPIC